MAEIMRSLALTLALFVAASAAQNGRWCEIDHDVRKRSLRHHCCGKAKKVGQDWIDWAVLAGAGVAAMGKFKQCDHHYNFA